MLTALVLGAIVLFAGGVVVVWRRVMPHRALPPVTQRTPTVFALERGDIVQHTGTDYIVDSTIHYEQDGLGWQAHLLGGGDRDRWLVVEEDDRVAIALVEEVDDPGLGLPTSLLDQRETVVFRGETYRLREAGVARATRILPGSGMAQTVRCEYLDYDGPDGQVLYIELWPPHDSEISHGRRVVAGALNVLPGA
jgi:uncharacterized protein DUF4178